MKIECVNNLQYIRIRVQVKFICNFFGIAQLDQKSVSKAVHSRQALTTQLSKYIRQISDNASQRSHRVVENTVCYICHLVIIYTVQWSTKLMQINKISCLEIL
ncbi:Hypothetical_protein [Hexamita inflata]|uniref:Hypothetical_protein n=1 Tax=Hexamita inflata TaxID=28002 RepID=A0AA86URV5_9EUKA|nr:Hypothetical protein HINF_LOCUS50057 [Hexamita inflata]